MKRRPNIQNVPKGTINVDTLAILSDCNSAFMPQIVNDEGRRKRWVGIGWVDEGPATGKEVRVTR
jgi:hypothetical protein